MGQIPRLRQQRGLDDVRSSSIDPSRLLAPFGFDGELVTVVAGLERIEEVDAARTELGQRSPHDRAGDRVGVSLGSAISTPLVKPQLVVRQTTEPDELGRRNPGCESGTAEVGAVREVEHAGHRKPKLEPSPVCGPDLSDLRTFSE